jgi:cysteine desulfurase/selenocysteine lyase
VHAYELELTSHLLSMLEEMDGVDVYGPRSLDARGGAVSFNVAGVHAHDVGTILDREGVAVRAGHHCCQPLMKRLGVAATARASVYLYNTHEEIDTLGAALGEVRRIFG